VPAHWRYKLRVYMMRNAARRNEVANYTLTVGITRSPQAVGLGKALASDAKTLASLSLWAASRVLRAL
jgi:hypothetical protein